MAQAAIACSKEEAEVYAEMGYHGLAYEVVTTPGDPIHIHVVTTKF